MGRNIALADLYTAPLVQKRSNLCLKLFTNVTLVNSFKHKLDRFCTSGMCKLLYRSRKLIKCVLDTLTTVLLAKHRMTKFHANHETQIIVFDLLTSRSDLVIASYTCRETSEFQRRVQLELDVRNRHEDRCGCWHNPRSIILELKSIIGKKNRRK